MLTDTPYTAKLGPRDARGIRARPSFEVARMGSSTVHLAERGQAGQPVVVAFCGARLPYAQVTMDTDVWIDCDGCRRLRTARQKWCYV